MLGTVAAFWSLMNPRNQKGRRPVDQPVPFSRLTDEQAFIQQGCPELRIEVDK